MNANIENLISGLANDTSHPFYLYSSQTIDEQISRLKQHLSMFDILYSIKTNPHKDVVRHILSNGFGADAASAAEAALSIELGAKPSDIFYSAPGKTRGDILQSMDKCTIIADSLSELTMLNSVAKEQGRHLDVGIRINPAFDMFGAKGASTKFGIDEEIICDNERFFSELDAISIVGIHVHLRSQMLDESLLGKYYENTILLALRCCEHMKWDLRFINFGGGLGIPYSSRNDKPLKLEHIAQPVQYVLSQHPALRDVRLMIESGRYIVGEAGWYATPIVDIKQSRGTKYIVVRNGLNGFMRPAISVLLLNAGAQLDGYSAEPLFTATDAFDFHILGKQGGPVESASIVGNLCTATDTLAENVALPKADIGDWLIISKAGSYSYSVSPLLFSSHELPKQHFV